MSLKSPFVDEPETKLLEPTLRDEASSAKRQRLKQSYESELQDFIKHLDEELQSQLHHLISKIIKESNDVDKCHLTRMISEAIQTNIDAIKSLQDGELKVEGLEDSTLAMAEDTQKALMSCILDAETCRGILDSLPMIPEPQSRHLEEYMTNIQDKCQEKGRELDEWKVKLEAEKKKRTRHEEESKEKSVGMLRQQIRRWLRVKELAGVSLESEFEDTATYFGFVES